MYFSTMIYMLYILCAMKKTIFYADPKSGTDNIHTGTPLTQILIYCRHFGCPEVIDPDVFQHLLLEYTEQELNIHIASFLPLDQSECNISLDVLSANNYCVSLCI